MVQQSKTGQNKENKTSRELEGDIQETRDAITTDIRELSDKFSPSHLKEEAKSAVASVANTAAEKAVEVKDVIVDKAIEVKDTAAEKLHEAKDTVVEAVDEVSEQARRIGGQTWEFAAANAVPLALLGIGAGWLIANSRRTQQPRYPRYYDERELAPRYEEEWEFDEEPMAMPSGTNRSRRRTRPAARAQRAVSKARDLGSDGAHALSDGAQKLKARATQSAQSVKQGLQRAGTATRNFAEENPLAIATAALIAGVGVGLALPSSEPERRLMGPTRAKFDQYVGDARSAASDVAHVAKDTASESIRSLT